MREFAEIRQILDPVWICQSNSTNKLHYTTAFSKTNSAPVVLKSNLHKKSHSFFSYWPIYLFILVQYNYSLTPISTSAPYFFLVFQHLCSGLSLSPLSVASLQAVCIGFIQHAGWGRPFRPSGPPAAHPHISGQAEECPAAAKPELGAHWESVGSCVFVLFLCTLIRWCLLLEPNSVWVCVVSKASNRV